MERWGDREICIVRRCAREEAERNRNVWQRWQRPRGCVRARSAGYNQHKACHAQYTACSVLHRDSDLHVHIAE